MLSVTDEIDLEASGPHLLVNSFHGVDIVMRHFQTSRLLIRPVTSADIPAYQKYFADYDIIRYLTPATPWPFPDDGVERFLEEVIFPAQGKTHWLLGLFLKTAPEALIGAIHLRQRPNPDHRGFWLAKVHHGKGLMSEALIPVMDYAFDELGFEKMNLSNAVGNVPSRRVKEKTGARFLRVEPGSFVDPAFNEREI